MNKIISTFCLLILFGCTNPKTNPSPPPAEPKPSLSVTTPSTATEDFHYKNTVFGEGMIKTASFHFSNTKEQDSFTITIPKGPITASKSSLQIVKSNGDVLLLLEFPTSDFVATYMLPEMTSYQDVLDHIRGNVATSLSEDNLIDLENNRLISNATKEEFNDYRTYRELKKEGLPLFDFKLGNELHSYYGYSGVTNKAEVIFECC